MNARLPAALVLALVFAAPAAAAGEDRDTPAPAPAPAPAEDVLVLKGGGEVRGRITAEDDAAFAVKVGGALRVVEKGAVAEVRRGAPAEDPAPGDAGGAGQAAPPTGGEAPRRDGEGKEKGKGKGRKGEGGGAGKDARGEAPGGPPADAPPLSDAARAWAKTCVERLLDPAADPAVRKSAVEALRALGPAVKPVLEEARASAGKEARGLLERVAASLGAPRPGAPPAPPGEGADRRRPEAPAGKEGEGRGGKARSILERVRTELGLDEAGARAVGAKLLEFGREMRTTLEDARDGLITYEEARTKVSEQRARLRDALSGTLDADQQAKLDALLDGLAPGKRK